MKQANFDIEEVKEYIKNSSDESMIHIGSDSEKFKRHGKVYVRFSTVVIIHKDGRHGSKIFGKVTDEDLDKDHNPSKPFTRMWNEALKVSELFTELEESIGNKKFALHLDINPDASYGSNIAYHAAKGYILSMHGIEPLFKPDAFAASHAADRMGHF